MTIKIVPNFTNIVDEAFAFIRNGSRVVEQGYIVDSSKIGKILKKGSKHIGRHGRENHRMRDHKNLINEGRA